MSDFEPEATPGGEPAAPASRVATPETSIAVAVPGAALGLRLLFAFVGVAVLYSFMLVAGGPLREFAVAGLQVIPFAILAVLAYAVRPEALWLKTLTIGYWVFLMAALGFMAVLFVFAALVIPSIEPVDGRLDPSAGGANISGYTLMLIGLSFVAVTFSGLLSLCCFLPAVRTFAARYLNIEAGSFLHAIALATVVATTLICMVPLFVSGEPPLQPLLQMEASIDLGSQDEQLRATVYSLIWAVPTSLLAVGYPTRRSFRMALERLALVRPTVRQLIAAGVLTGVLVVLMTQLEQGIAWFWMSRGWQVTDEDAIAELFQFAVGPVGAVVVGTAAGLGEELVFRGMLQPRLGIILPALMFTSVHAFQYDFDALLQVFLLGIVFGVIRNRSNTTTTAIIHGGYDCVLLLWMYFTGS